jgi:hypothetical protein
MPDPSSLPYAAPPKPVATVVVKGGPPSWGPFVVAVVGTVIGAGLLAVVWPGVLPMTLVTVPFVIIPGMILAFTAAGASMGWMFLLFGRFGRRTRWLWPSGILIAVVILELLALTYLAGIADQAASGG